MLKLRIPALAAGYILCCAMYAQSDPPIATLTAGYTYLYADQGMNERSHLSGWFVRPAVNIGKGYSLFADSTNYYGANRKGSLNSHGYTFGVAKVVFAHPRFSPSIFVEAGNVRVSNAGTIVNQLAIAGGVSISFPLRKGFSFVVTPAEYVFLYPKGDWRNDFNTKVGISYGFGKR